MRLTNIVLLVIAALLAANLIRIPAVRAASTIVRVQVVPKSGFVDVDGDVVGFSCVNKGAYASEHSTRPIITPLLVQTGPLPLDSPERQLSVLTAHSWPRSWTLTIPYLPRQGATRLAPGGDFLLSDSNWIMLMTLASASTQFSPRIIVSLVRNGTLPGDQRCLFLDESSKTHPAGVEECALSFRSCGPSRHAS